MTHVSCVCLKCKMLWNEFKNYFRNLKSKIKTKTDQIFRLSFRPIKMKTVNYQLWKILGVIFIIIWTKKHFIFIYTFSFGFWANVYAFMLQNTNHSTSSSMTLLAIWLFNSFIFSDRESEQKAMKLMCEINGIRFIQMSENWIKCTILLNACLESFRLDTDGNFYQIIIAVANQKIILYLMGSPLSFSFVFFTFFSNSIFYPNA